MVEVNDSAYKIHISKSAVTLEIGVIKQLHQRTTCSGVMLVDVWQEVEK